MHDTIFRNNYFDIVICISERASFEAKQKKHLKLKYNEIAIVCSKLNLL